jgi:hypothetical protein
VDVVRRGTRAAPDAAAGGRLGLAGRAPSAAGEVLLCVALLSGVGFRKPLILLATIRGAMPGARQEASAAMGFQARPMRNRISTPGAAGLGFANWSVDIPVHIY